MRRTGRPAPVIDFWKDSPRHRRRRARRSLLLALAGFALSAAGGAALLSWSPASQARPEAVAARPFAVCEIARSHCVVDGDTIWLEGVKIRIADIDTPEIGEPRCDSEYRRGIQARDRLVELLNAGPFEVTPIGGRDEDRYGRKLRVLTRDGHSLGDRLVGDGLARTWTGRREPWC